MLQTNRFGAAPSPFEQRVDVLLSRRGCESEVRRQLNLLPPGILSRVKRADQSLEDYVNAVPICDALLLLTTKQKIVALVQTIGVARAYTTLGLNPELAEEGEALRKEIAAITDGVLSVYQLNAYRMLRMRFFAALARSLESDSISNVVTTELRNQAQSMFNLVDGQIHQEDFKATRILDNGLDKMIASFEVCQETANRGANISLRNDLELILKILKTINRARTKPEHFLPLLLKPIQFQPVSLNTEARHFYEFSGMDRPKIKQRMNEFLSAWKVQADCFYPFFEEVLKGHEKWKESKEELESIQLAFHKLFENFRVHFRQLHAVLDGLDNFERLPLDEQHKKGAVRETLKTSGTALSENFNRLIQDYLPLQARLVKLISPCTGHYRGPDPHFKSIDDVHSILLNHMDSSIHFPFHYLLSLHTGVITTVLSCCQINESFHQLIEKVLDPRFCSLNGVMLVDLLDISVRMAFREWQESGEKTAEHAIPLLQVYFDAILTDMRRYYAERKKLKGRSIHDLKLDASSMTCAVEAAKSAANLRKNTQEPNTSKLLELYENLGDCLQHLLKKDEWPNLLLNNPLAVEKSDPSLERKFHAELLSLLRHRFLTFDPELVYQGYLRIEVPLDEKPLVEAVRSSLAQIIAIIQQYRTRVARSEFSQASFHAEAKSFLGDVTQCAAEIEEISEPLELTLGDYLEAHPQCSAPLKKLAVNLSEIRDNLLCSLFSSARSLSRFLLVEELTAQKLPVKPAKKAEKPRSRPIPKPTIVEKPSHTPSPKAPPVALSPALTTLHEGLTAFQAGIERLSECNRAFVATSKEGVERVALLNEWSSTLKEKLSSLEEQIKGFETHGDQPCFVSALYLNMGVALEMIGKLVALNQHIPVAAIEKGNAVLQRQGRDYHWQEHSPYLYFKEVVGNVLKSSRKLILTKEELASVQKFERVVSLSSRYPASAHDELYEILQGLLSNQSEEVVKEKVRKTILGAFQASVSLMQKTLDGDAQKRQRGPLDATSIQTAFRDPVPHEQKSQEEWEREVAKVVSSLEERVQRIQQYRRIGFNGKVPYIDERDQTTHCREGTIHGALKDLKINLQLAESLLTQADSPYLCQTLGEESLLRQSVLLEQVLLVLLSHLPIPANRSNIHCLWETDEHNQRPLRYRHLMHTLARLACDNLPNLDPRLAETAKEKAALLTPILQQLYRYPLALDCDARRLQKTFQTLSQLRSKVASKCLSPGEEDELGRNIQWSSPEEILPHLDRHILAVIQAQIKKPLLEMVKLTDHWLAIYEQQLSD